MRKGIRHCRTCKKDRDMEERQCPVCWPRYRQGREDNLRKIAKSNGHCPFHPGTKSARRPGGLCRRCLTGYQEWRQKNAGKISEKASRSLQEVRCLALGRYGMVCACCGEKEVRFLSFDHVENDGKLARSKGMYGKRLYAWIAKQGAPPETLRVLCFNCNLGRQFNGGVCPHQGA